MRADSAQGSDKNCIAQRSLRRCIVGGKKEGTNTTHCSPRFGTFHPTRFSPSIRERERRLSCCVAVYKAHTHTIKKEYSLALPTSLSSRAAHGTRGARIPFLLAPSLMMICGHLSSGILCQLRSVSVGADIRTHIDPSPPSARRHMSTHACKA